MKLAGYLILFLTLVPFAHGLTVVVNSDDWMDVYSGVHYANLQDFTAKFMTNKRYATTIEGTIPKSEKIMVIESSKIPFTVNLAGTLRRSGYEASTIYASGGRATNIELAKLANTTNYIVIDPSYGYNAISVAPYALMTDSYVLFADRTNIDQVVTFLNNREIDKLLLYGFLDEGLVEKLAIFSPETISEGNRYKNNLAILKRQLAMAEIPQLVLTDGSIIEQELMYAGNNQETILLIGRDTVLDNTIRFVRQSGYKSAVLIGNHLSQSASRLKDETGVPVFLKFAQGITRGTENEPVNALDTFPLPTIDLRVVLKRVQYNTITKQVEVTLENKGVRAFLETDAGLLVNATRVAAIGDRDIQRIEPGEIQSFKYDIDLTEYVATGREVTIDLFTIYGESPDVLDHAIAMEGPLPIVSASDDCEVSVRSLQYNDKTQRFMVGLSNDGKVDCYADFDLVDIIVEDNPITVSYPGMAELRRRESKIFESKQRMTEVDLADNPTVHIKVNYGEREGFLLNALETRMPLERYSGKGLSTTGLLVSIIGLLIIIIVIMVYMMRKRGSRGR